MKASHACAGALIAALLALSVAHTCIKITGQRVINSCVKGEHIKFKLNDDITIKCEVVRGDD